MGKLRSAYPADPAFLRTKEFDKLYDRLDEIWHLLTETEIRYIELRLKEKGPRPVEISRKDMGLKHNIN